MRPRRALRHGAHLRGRVGAESRDDWKRAAMPYWGARCGGGLGHAGSRLARPARLVRMARVALLARVARLGRLARLERQARLARLARPTRLIRHTRLAPGPTAAPPVPGTAAAGVAAPPKRPGVRPLEVTTRGRSPRRGRHRLVRRWLVRRRRGGARKNCRSIASLQDSRQPSARGAHHGALVSFSVQLMSFSVIWCLISAN